MIFHFEKIEKIIEGYFEFLTLIPNFKNIKLEHIKGTEDALVIGISETRKHWSLNHLPSEYMTPDNQKTTITISIFANTEIIKGEELEIKPE